MWVETDRADTQDRHVLVMIHSAVNTNRDTWASLVYARKLSVWKQSGGN